MKKIHSGFTLIEMVMVIVLIGVLSAFAIPRFIDLSSDARLAVIDSTASALKSSANIVKFQALIENKNTCDDASIAIEGKNVTLRCGYPGSCQSGIGNAIEINDNFSWVGGNCGGQLGYIELRLKDAVKPAECKIRYSSARGSTPPSITKTVTGC